MRNNQITKFTLLLSFLALFNCINHPKGGVSASNILVYSEDTISEESSNAGIFNQEITVTLQGSEFVETLTEGEEFDTTDLPDGLTATVTRDSATQATITIAGTATTHNGCGKTKMAFYFLEPAFSDGKLPISFEAPIDIVYISPTLTYDLATLDEDTSNDGSFPDDILVTSSTDGGFATVGLLTDGTGYEAIDIPDGLTPTVTVNDALHATIHFSGTADDNTPFDDVEAAIKFKPASLSPDFCETIEKHTINLKMYRSIVMYASEATDGAIGGRTGADNLCIASMPDLPADYDTVEAFISISGADDIQGLNVPSGTIIESESGIKIADSKLDLLDGTIDNSLDAADVFDAGTLFWTGSDANGAIVADRCTDGSGWLSNDSGDTGQVGSSDVTTTDWLTNADTPENCDEVHPILCVAYVD